MKVRMFNIKWDTDENKVDLPTEVTTEVPADMDVAEHGADLLSDSYGWCVFGFEYEILTS